MRFLVDAGMPRATAELIRSLGHDAADVRDLGWGAQPDDFLAAQCQRDSRCMVTRDLDFADILAYPPLQYPGIVVFRLPEQANRELILGLVQSFFTMTDVIQLLPGRLAIVEVDRVRLRPSE